ncbi:hypothetical protein K438DRAFT_1754025 [Mycena galopus ATCC 62051]|nr:hypothetical protein K438DRAFT_1754025 [Mycena galopus ATCC 62051]
MSNPAIAHAEPEFAQVICAGCGDKFTPSGLGFHQARTSKPACHSIYLEQRRYIPQFADAIPGRRSPSLEVQDNIGDLDSDGEDFPGLIQVDDSDSDNEDEPPEWERMPAREDHEDLHAPMGSPIVEPQHLPEEPPPQEPRDIPVEERFLVKPFVTHFGGLAGACLQAIL